ncbi:hypothetical protein TNCV_3882851 [Trichonephila clavipes]|nr:hypothetical protein TNCV_3882851 [Trichonephila clavipes]
MPWGRHVAGRNYPPTNKNTLIRALTEECDKLRQQLLDNVVQMGYSKIWKTASVIPIPLKPGKDPTLTDSFRPISLFCSPVKLQRKLIKTLSTSQR